MTTLIVDASVAAALQIASQRTIPVEVLAEAWTDYQPIAPFVFDLEVPWLLLKHERRTGQGGFARRSLQSLRSYNVRVRPAPEDEDLALAFETAERNVIGLYDAHYLLLAFATGGVLASRDGGLINAATVFGVDVMDVR